MDPKKTTVEQKNKILDKIFPNNPAIKSKVNKLLAECRKANVLPNRRIPTPALCGGNGSKSGSDCQSDTIEDLLNQITSGGISGNSLSARNRDLTAGVTLTLAGIAAGFCDAFKAAVDYLGQGHELLPEIAAIVNTTLSKEHKVKAISNIASQTITDKVKAFEPDFIKDFMGDPNLNKESYAGEPERHIYKDTGYTERDSTLASDYMITTANEIDDEWHQGNSSIEKLTTSDGKANIATASVFTDALAASPPPSDPNAIPSDPYLDAKLAYISAA